MLWVRNSPFHGKHNDLTYPKSHSCCETGTQCFKLWVNMFFTRIELVLFPSPCCVCIYIFMLLFQVIYVSLIYSPLKWKEDVIHVHDSQNERPAGLGCYICNSIIFTACMLFCIQRQSILRVSHQVPREMGYSFHWPGKEQVAVPDFRMTHCSEPNRCRFWQ